ncbi:MAG: Arylsulfatase [Verrucomicrobiota bacterium]
MMRLLSLAAAILLPAAAPAAEDRAVPPRPPNIIVILADDLGWNELGCIGGARFPSPNLDRLAQNGLRFSQAYANGANCQPSRACLLSGNTTPRHEVYAVSSTDRGPDGPKRLVPVPNRDGLAIADITLADALKSAGYATGHFGKWHLAGKTGALPTQQGFDLSYDSFGEGPLKEGHEGNEKGPPSDPKGVHALTDKALAFIETHKKQPFFVYLAHHAVHGPYQSAPEDLARLKPKEGKAALYLGCLASLDRSVGKLVARLDELGLSRDTVIFFASDNGGNELSLEPLRGAKGGYYEGGIRIPLIVHAPGRLKPGILAAPAQLTDLFPTALELAGIPAPKTLDGNSLVPAFSQGALAERDLFWHFPGYLEKPVPRGRPADVKDGFRSRPVSVIRRGEWKLHLFHEEWLLDGGRAALPGNHAVELYNLAQDPGEQRDLAATEAARRDELLEALLAWMKRTEAKFGSLRRGEEK